MPMLAKLAWHRGITAPEWDNFGIIYQQGSVFILLDKLTENDIMTQIEEKMFSV